MSETNAAPDVRQLIDGELPDSAFPVPREQDFRFCFAESVHESIWKHASENLTVEICGVLVGSWARDLDGPYAIVSEYIRCDAAQSKFAEVTFTHESWTTINEQMDNRFSDLKIVGWYHSHPDFGVFLSERDCFIQENFFSGAGQVAHVVDPVRKTEGVFVWRDGKPTPCSHFWIGDRIRVGVTNEAPSTSGTPDELSQSTESSPERTALGTRVSTRSTIGWLLPIAAAFLLGYFLAGTRSTWEQHRLVEGTVAHYGLWKGLRPGLNAELGKSEADLSSVTRQLDALASEHVKAVGKDAKKTKQAWSEVRTQLDATRRQLRQVETLYGLTAEEEVEVRRMVARKLAELQQPKKKTRADRESPKQTSPPGKQGSSR